MEVDKTPLDSTLYRPPVLWSGHRLSVLRFLVPIVLHAFQASHHGQKRHCCALATVLFLIEDPFSALNSWSLFSGSFCAPFTTAPFLSKRLSFGRCPYLSLHECSFANLLPQLLEGYLLQGIDSKALGDKVLQCFKDSIYDVTTRVVRSLLLTKPM